MRWFEHRHDLRYVPSFVKIQQRLGEVGYARAVQLLEITARFGERSGRFTAELDTKGETDLQFLLFELSSFQRGDITMEELVKTLDVFAECRFIDSEGWQRKVIRIPMLLESLDEYTRKRDKRKGKGDDNQGSGQYPNSVPIASGDVAPYYTTPQDTTRHHTHTT